MMHAELAHYWSALRTYITSTYHISNPALVDMRPVGRYLEEGLHDGAGVLHAVHRLEERDDVHRHVFFSPPAPPQQTEHEQHRELILGMADDIAVAPCFAIFILNGLKLSNILDGILNNFIIKLLWDCLYLFV